MRISLFSGGDMKSFYANGPGHCLSCTIDKYVYVSVLRQPQIDFKYRITYEDTENSLALGEVKNDIVREAIDLYCMDDDGALTINSMNDLPASGTGLGSSSAFTVGLLNCFTHLRSELLEEDCNHAYHLAADACEVEIDRCGHPIGKQDQYAAAIGGLNHMKFWNDETVDIHASSGAYMNLYRAQSKIILAYTGIARRANDILREQNTNLENNRDAYVALARNASRAVEAYEILRNNKDIDYIGELLHEAWIDKKKVATAISNPKIDEIYENAKNAGAIGGKVIGAGGGGFMIFWVPNHSTHYHVWDTLEGMGLSVHNFKFVDYGSQVYEI